MAEKYFEGIGRRKSSVARVRVFKGTTPSTINEVASDTYFKEKGAQAEMNQPLTVSGLDGKYYFTAKVAGGGTTGQKEAIRLGVARALIKMDEALKPALRKAGLVTRDPRTVERKKVDFRKARKKPQFSKR